MRSPLVDGGERHVLGDPGAERRDVLLFVLHGTQAVLVEPSRRLLGRSRARECQHRAVLEPNVIRVLGQTPLGEVERAQQLTAPLSFPDRSEPRLDAGLSVRNPSPPGRLVCSGLTELPGPATQGRNRTL